MIKVLVAGDRPIVVKGINQILSDTPDIVPVLEACNGQQMMEMIRTHPLVDAVVLSSGDSGADLIGTLDGLHMIRPRLAVVVVSDNEIDPDLWRRPFTWLATKSSSEELVTTIRNAVHQMTSSEAHEPLESVSKLTAPMAGLSE
jgi:DNA-binding NarL/FixJ family response regulator